MPYALFDCDRKVGDTLPTVREVWLQALEAGLISDLPVADEDGAEVLPADVLPIGYDVREVADDNAPDDAPVPVGRQW